MRKKSEVDGFIIFLISGIFTLTIIGFHDANARAIDPDDNNTISSTAFEADGSVELIFDVSIGSRIVGELIAVRNVQSDSTVYRISSDIEAHIGFHLTNDYLLESVFREGILERSALRNVVNEKVRADTKIHWSGERYIANRHKEFVLETPPVKFSVAQLFFLEPAGTNRIFSENYADFIECRPGKSNLYQKYCFFLPNRSRVFYYYSNGICKQIEVKSLILNVRYSLKSVNPLP